MPQSSFNPGSFDEVAPEPDRLDVPEEYARSRRGSINRDEAKAGWIDTAIVGTGGSGILIIYDMLSDAAKTAYEQNIPTILVYPEARVAISAVVALVGAAALLWMRKWAWGDRK